jgi:hypothetical protein
MATRTRLPPKYAFSHGCSEFIRLSTGPSAMILPSANAATRSHTECRL